MMYGIKHNAAEHRLNPQVLWLQEKKHLLSFNEELCGLHHLLVNSAIGVFSDINNIVIYKLTMCEEMSVQTNVVS